MFVLLFVLEAFGENPKERVGQRWPGIASERERYVYSLIASYLLSLSHRGSRAHVELQQPGRQQNKLAGMDPSLSDGAVAHLLA